MRRIKDWLRQKGVTRSGLRWSRMRRIVSDWACSRALNEFLSGKPEKPILIPDAWGTALLRKI